MRIPAIAQRLALAAAAWLALSAPAWAQSHDGAWAGVLQVPNGPLLHLVLHVETKGGETAASLESVDQGGVVLPASAYKADGNKASILFLAAGAEIEGEYAADGKTFTGKFRQGGELPITLTRAEKP